MKNFFIGAVVTTVMMVPVHGMVSAATATDTVPSGSNPGTSVPSGSNPTDNVPSGSNPGTSGGGSVTLTNPLSSDSLVDFLKSVIDVILVFAIPIIVLFIMYSGFLFVVARGEPAQIQKARAALTWAVIGGVIVLGARAILEVIQVTVTAITK